MVDDLSTGAQAVPKSDGPAAIVGQFWPMMERCELAGADALQTDLIGPADALYKTRYPGVGPGGGSLCRYGNPTKGVTL
jgi:hypothetical protein